MAKRANGETATRCAIYTRKSSEEGLEQDFNSPDAPPESCQAFILTQKAECWPRPTHSHDAPGCPVRRRASSISMRRWLAVCLAARTRLDTAPC